MSKKQVIVIAALAAAAVLQASLAPHFLFWGGAWFEWFNFVDLAVVVIALFEKKSRRLGWAAAAWGGFWLDLYSGRFFGFWIVALLAVTAFIKLALKKYVRIPSYW